MFFRGCLRLRSSGFEVSESKTSRISAINRSPSPSSRELYQSAVGDPAQFPVEQLHASSFAGATANAFFEFVQRHGGRWIFVMGIETGLDERFFFGTQSPIL